MTHKISNGHLSASNKGRVACKEPQCNEEPAKKPDYARQSRQRKKGSRLARVSHPAKDAKQLSGSVTSKQQTDYDSHHRIEIVRVLSEKSLH